MSRALLLLPLLAACSTVDTGAEVREAPPAALIVAVDEIADVPANGAPNGGLHFAATPTQFRTMLVEGLRRVDAASRVVSRSEIADEAQVDLVIRPRVVPNSAAFSHDGASGNWWAAGGLWLVTWIGGLAVNDSTYRAKLALDCTYDMPGTPGGGLARQLRSDVVELSFLERNDFFSWPTLQAIVLPPFFTSDDTETTSAALTEQAADRLAIEMAAYLKRSFEEEALEQKAFNLQVDEPKNGARIDGESIVLNGRVRTKGIELESVAFAVDEQAPVTVTGLRGDYDPNTQTWTYPLSVPIGGLRAGDNIVRMTARPKGSSFDYKRTLRFRRGSAR